MSLQKNVLFPSLPCSPIPPPLHIGTTFKEAKVSDRKRKKTKPHWNFTVQLGLHTQCIGEWILSDFKLTEHCGWDGMGGWESIPQERTTSSMWGGVQQSDSKFSRVGKQNFCLWQPGSETVAKRGRAHALVGISVGTVSYRWLECLVFLRLGLSKCHCTPKMAKWFLFLHENVPCSQVLPTGFISTAALTLTNSRWSSGRGFATSHWRRHPLPLILILLGQK